MQAPPTYLETLRAHPGFRYLFGARMVSLTGDWLSMLAVIALLREVTGTDAGALSGFFILKLLPIFLAGPLAGVFADRFSRRRIMLGSDLIRSLTILALLLAPYVSRPVVYIYALVLLQVVASAFFEPARSASLPQLVSKRHLATANALGALMWSTVFAFGAALGGVITDLAGWRFTLVLDAGTYLVSAALITRIQLPPRPPRPKVKETWKTISGWADLSEAIRFVVGRPDVATVLFLKLGWGLAGAGTLFLTMFGERVYLIQGRPDLSVAMLFTARAIGTGLGPWIARRLLRDESSSTMRRMLTLCFAWASLWYLAFSFVSTIWTAALCVTIAHLGGSIIWVYSTVLIQRMVPDGFLGRVASADLGFATLSISTSVGLFGWLIVTELGDLRMLVRLMALSLLIPTLIWYLSARRWPVGKPSENK